MINSVASCFNCCHWKNTYSEDVVVLWEVNEPDWNEKSCKNNGIERKWPDRAVIGVMVTKYQSGSVAEVKIAIAAQCPEYAKVGGDRDAIK